MQFAATAVAASPPILVAVAAISKSGRSSKVTRHSLVHFCFFGFVISGWLRVTVTCDCVDVDVAPNTVSQSSILFNYYTEHCLFDEFLFLCRLSPPSPSTTTKTTRKRMPF